MFSYSNQEIEHGAVSYLNYPITFTTKKMAEENKIEVPNFEATSDGRIFTLKQWLERFRQNTKRKNKMDITELIRGAEITQTGWSGKEAEIQEDFIWGIGPEALYQMTRAEYKTTQQNSGKRPYPTIQRILLTKAEHLSQPRGILLDKTNRTRDTGRLLAETH